MNSKAVVSAILAMSLATGGLAFADDHGDRNDQGRNAQAQRGGEWRQSDRRENRGRANNNADRRDERGAGPNHDFRRGQRLPREYRNRQYVVDDWRGHHLSAPPRGYHWVQTGGDYVLVAIATGVILQLLLNH
jgi:Ni/Co efflux regulator RcnB